MDLPIQVCVALPSKAAYLDRCGYGPRLPLIVISPFARENFVDNSVTDQSSILRFIEDNWQLGSIGNQSTDAIAGTLNKPVSTSSILTSTTNSSLTHNW